MAQTDTQTNRQTDGHGDSMTNSAQWGRVGENGRNVHRKHFIILTRDDTMSVTRIIHSTSASWIVPRSVNKKIYTINTISITGSVIRNYFMKFYQDCYPK